MGAAFWGIGVIEGAEALRMEVLAEGYSRRVQGGSSENSIEFAVRVVYS